MSKQCRLCKTVYLDVENNFHKDSKRKDGRDSRCKYCKKEQDNSFSQQKRDAKRYAKLKNRVLARTAAYKHYANNSFKCSVITCQEKDAQLHHFDYDLPFDVIPLCEKHHRAIHESLI